MAVAPVEAPPTVSPGVAPSVGSQGRVAPSRAWLTIVWDDPVNLMSYVTYVFRTYFGYPEAEAERLMMKVHTEGRAVVSSGTREEMERDVTAMHEHGLWATLQQDD
ncbi:MAG: ATP-dependent Clp protease adapter ClpS [Kineosporiaceae bacterium]